SLSWFDLQKIARKARIVEYKKGSFICKQDNPADAFYCLISGRVQSYSQENGKKTHVEFIRRGMHFGIISLLTGESHSHTYEAINDSVVLKIEKDDFAAVVQGTPKLAVALSQS